MGQITHTQKVGHSQDATRMLVAYSPEPDTQEISYACVFDSGSPLFAQVEGDRLALGSVDNHRVAMSMAQRCQLAA